MRGRGKSTGARLPSSPVVRICFREAAFILAALLVSCGGGGGAALSPLAPGAVAPAATPAPTLAVAPAQNTFAAIGSTAQVTATISTGQANVQVAYVGGCTGIASVSPPTQMTTVGGSTPPYTLTALQANAACRAQFSAEGATATTVATVGTATPPPSPVPTLAPTPSPAPSATSTPPATPSPTPVPTVGPLVVTPTSAVIGNSYPATAMSVIINASRANYTGTFMESDTCGLSGYASVASVSASSWTVTWTSPSSGFAGTFNAPCAVTISAQSQQVVVPIQLSGVGVIVE